MDPRMSSYLRWSSLWQQSIVSLLLTCEKELQHSCHKNPGSCTAYHNIITETFSRMFYQFVMLNSIILRNKYNKHFLVIISFITSREEIREFLIY